MAKLDQIKKERAHARYAGGFALHAHMNGQLNHTGDMFEIAAAPSALQRNKSRTCCELAVLKSQK